MIIFEDKPKAFYPLSLTRSVGDLRCGVMKLRQRLQFLFDDKDNHILCEERLKPIYQERHPDWILSENIEPGELCLNSRLKVTDEVIGAIKKLHQGQCLVCKDGVIAFVSTKDKFRLPEVSSLSGYEIVEADPGTKLYNNLADLIHDNERMIVLDFEQIFDDRDNYFETEPGVTTLNPYNIWIAEKVVLKPGVVLDASAGPIILDEGVSVLANAVIMGPVYIGKGTLVKIGAKICGGTSVGPVCKIGGEIEGSIIQAYSNKQHDGFLGHSYLGEWVNLGADTNNSDLKNNYKNVSFYAYELEKKIDSGSPFLGTFIGDHAKLGINTSINTGCVIGIGSNLWGSDLIADFITDFSWGMAKDLNRYRFDAFCETAGLVKARRKLEWTLVEKELYKQIYSCSGN
jgi:UDP-N-acetylglucosamine diphosphorylase / glucose-1-phosphate thymidylyltransferase / UDP-N-acetylgalactosamine diphosphorylase / glucosamine-1-phosphate N-acetyltransferase / galactosamine-1-phosphate N-acetyltransferase